MPASQHVLLLLLLLLLVLQAKKGWEAEMKERGLSKEEAFMVETAQSAEIVSQHKSKKEKHKAAFGERGERFSRFTSFFVLVDFHFCTLQDGCFVFCACFCSAALTKKLTHECHN